jgi:predicted RNA-binding protein YlqC (UPF0109 family)
MSKDVLTSRAPDRSKINLANDDEAKYWARELEVDLPELAKVIEKVGNSAATVRKELAAAPAKRR